MAVAAGQADDQCSDILGELVGVLRRIGEQKNEFGSDYEKLLELGGEEEALKTQLDAKYDAWAELGE